MDVTPAYTEGTQILETSLRKVKGFLQNLQHFLTLFYCGEVPLIPTTRTVGLTEKVTIFLLTQMYIVYHERVIRL